MSVQLKGLRSLIYPSSDLVAAKAWWSTLLGFGPYFDEPFYVGFNVGGYELGLVASDDDGGPTTYWGVDDIAVAVAEAEASGGTVHETPQDVGDGILVASFVNPHGQKVGLICN
ncbi:MAG: VOC family protein, partial [Acidimicrobiales bacterium]